MRRNGRASVQRVLGALNQRPVDTRQYRIFKFDSIYKVLRDEQGQQVGLDFGWCGSDGVRGIWADGVRSEMG